MNLFASLSSKFQVDMWLCVCVCMCVCVCVISSFLPEVKIQNFQEVNADKVSKFALANKTSFAEVCKQVRQ